MFRRRVLAALMTLTAATAAAQPLGERNEWLNTPDRVAWSQFLAVSAVTGNGQAVLFETWAHDSDTFREKPEWPAGATPLRIKPRALAMARRPVRQMPQGDVQSVYPLLLGVDPTESVEETRRNRVTLRLHRPQQPLSGVRPARRVRARVRHFVSGRVCGDQGKLVSRRTAG